MDKQKKLENKGVEFKPITVNEVHLTFPNMNYEVISNNNSAYADSIIFGDETIVKGDRFTCTSITKNQAEYIIEYKVNAIITDGSRTIGLIEGIYNKTTMFVLPLVCINKLNASFITNNGGYLINSFIDCDFIEKKDKYSIFLLLKYLKSDRYKFQEEMLITNEHFVKTIDDNPNYVIYEFSIPIEFREDFDKLLNGKYSKISGKAKSRIINFHGSHHFGSIVNGVLNKTPQMKLELEEKLGVNMDEFEFYGRLDHYDILTKELL